MTGKITDPYASLRKEQLKPLQVFLLFLRDEPIGKNNRALMFTVKRYPGGSRIFYYNNVAIAFIDSVDERVVYVINWAVPGLPRIRQKQKYLDELAGKYEKGSRSGLFSGSSFSSIHVRVIPGLESYAIMKAARKIGKIVIGVDKEQIKKQLDNLKFIDRLRKKERVQG